MLSRGCTSYTYFMVGNSLGRAIILYHFAAPSHPKHTTIWVGTFSVYIFQHINSDTNNSLVVSSFLNTFFFLCILNKYWRTGFDVLIKIINGFCEKVKKWLRRIVNGASGFENIDLMFSESYYLLNLTKLFYYKITIFDFWYQIDVCINYRILC